MSQSALLSIEKNLTKRDDANEELAMQLAPHFNYVEQISPAPLAINAMGHLAVISIKANDFDLVKRQSGKARKHDSFKANLMQVCNLGHNAFQTAHVSMGAIQQATNRIPVEMKQAVQILVNGNKVHMEHFLPKTLGSIKGIADDCLKHAKAAEKNFSETQDMISDLLEDTMATKGSTDKEKETLKILKEQSEAHKAMLEDRKRKQSEERNRLSKELEDRTKAYAKALDDMPSGWEVIGMTVVENLTGAIVDGVKLMTTTAAMAKTGIFQPATTSPGNGESNEVHSQYTSSDLDLLRLCDNWMERLVDLRKNLVEENVETKEMEKRGDSRIFANNSSLIEQEIKLNSSGAMQQVKEKVLPVLQSIMNTMNHYAQSWPEIKLEDAQKKLEEHLDKLRPLSSEYSAASGKMTLNAPTPHASTAASKAVGQGDSATHTAIKNAQFKVTQATEMLKDVEKNYNMANDQLMSTNENLSTVMQELAKHDANDLKMNEILVVLKKGLLKLGDLKIKWSKLTTFFEEMALLIEVSMNEPMKLFGEYAKSVGEVRKGGVPMDKLMCDLIYGTARRAVAYGYVVNRMSAGYHEISTNHLMEPVATLAKLMTLDKETDITTQQQKLDKEASDAQAAIKEKQRVEYSNFKQYIEKKVMTINSAFEEVTVGLDEDQKKMIENQVRDGRSVVIEEISDDSPINADDW